MYNPRLFLHYFYILHTFLTFMFINLYLHYYFDHLYDHPNHGC